MAEPMPDSSPKPAMPSEFTTRISTLSGWVFCAFLLVSFASAAWLLISGKVELLPPNLTQDQVLHGEVTHKIAKQLSMAVVPERAADLERAASWLAFHDTGARVRPGCDGWLFLTDEMRINRHAQDNAEAKAAVVHAVQQRLAKQGIELLVAVVPDKSRIAASQLCDLRRPAQLQHRAQAWVDGLNKAGVKALDLAPTLQPLGAEAFLRTDTHWSEIGSSAAAKAIAQQIQALGFSATPPTEYDRTVQSPARRPGDLVHLAGLDWLSLRSQPAPESVTASEFTEKQTQASSEGDSLDDLFGDDNLPNVALIGTSFSRNSNFVGFLQQALRAPVGNFSKDGGEFSGAANVYFSNSAFKDTPPKLVIWEIPERDLQTPYSEVIKWAE